MSRTRQWRLRKLRGRKLLDRVLQDSGDLGELGRRVTRGALCCPESRRGNCRMRDIG